MSDVRRSLSPDDSHPAAPRPEARPRAASRVEIEALAKHPLLRAVLDAADVSVMVLSRQRQILVGNAALLNACAVAPVDFLESLRPGEALGCIHAEQSETPCGAAPACSVCGAHQAILGSQREGGPVERECLMTVRRGKETEALELHVRATQLDVGGERYTVLGLRDTSAEKRREALERVFLHDVSNTVGPLLVSAEMLAARVSESEREIVERVTRLAHRLRRDIEEQRVLLEAEKGTLQVVRSVVSAREALETARELLEGVAQSSGRSLEIACEADLTLETDEALLVRILVNMLKNALEATPEGGTVRAAAAQHGTDCEFRVWNAGAMAPATALQVFQRSFSTKGDPSRGIGTFSIRLLGERYLGGHVGFTSTPGAGTTFFIRLPA